MFRCGDGKLRFCLILALVCSFACCSQVTAKSPEPLSQPASAENSANGVDDYSAATAEPITPADSAESSESQEQNQSNQNAGEPGAVSEVKRLANLEALLNLVADGAQSMGMVVGAPVCLLLPMGVVLVCRKGKRLLGAVMVTVGPALVVLSIVVPQIIDLFIASGRDAGVFK